MEYGHFSPDLDASLASAEGYERIYVGEEFCDKFLLRQLKRIEETIDRLIISHSISVIFPLVNESSVTAVERLIDRLIIKYPNQIEFVCNDIGMMNLLIKKNCSTIVAGRMLTRVILSYLMDKEDRLGLVPYVKRVELDSTNLLRMRQLRKYKISYYDKISIYGNGNNRCCFKTGGKEFGQNAECNVERCSQPIPVTNGYLNEDFILFRNAVLKQDELRMVPALIDRIIHVEI